MVDTAQLVKDKLNIVDVVTPYVKISRAGKYWKGVCPFHKEKTPSFMVSPDRGFYHCFGCGKGGDIFTFVEEMEGTDFKGALKILAEKAGIPLVYEHGAKEDRGERERLLGALETAREFFVNTLESTPAALEYLTSRGVRPDALALWSLGYAPAEWHALLEALAKQGFTELEIERAGLAKKKEGTSNLYDTFRSRIMFPIRDREGRTIAFTGRIFPDEKDTAKYLNSPETPVFQKSKVLYGLDLARAAIRKYGFAILVEGQVDLIMVHQTGYGNAVATSGTAFTEEHAAVLMRLTPNLVIAYDGDAAGVSAAGRAAAIALAAGMNVKVAAMPAGEDPADVVRRDPEVWKAAVKHATHIVDFYLDYLAAAGYRPRELKLEVSRTVLPYVAMIGNAIDRAHFTERVASALGVPVEAVVAEVKKLRGTSLEGRAQPHTSHLTPQSIVPAPFLSRGEALEQLLVGIAAALEGNVSALLTPFADREADRGTLVEGDLFLERYTDEEGRDAAIRDIIGEWEKEAAHDHYRAAVRALKSAEDCKDAEATERLMAEVAALARKLD